MPQFVDPYVNFKFRVKWDGKNIAGITRISCLKRSTSPIVSRSGDDPSSSHILPGTWMFAPLTIERGITDDPEFENWANLSFKFAGAISQSYRKDILIELLNEQGILVKAFKVYRCWVSEYQVLPVLDANANSLAIETITLENEGWERDSSVKLPA
jgi:phage tail-like protein